MLQFSCFAQVPAAVIYFSDPLSATKSLAQFTSSTFLAQIKFSITWLPFSFYTPHTIPAPCVYQRRLLPATFIAITIWNSFSIFSYAITTALDEDIGKVLY